jgi:hypothetical protein
MKITQTSAIVEFPETIEEGSAKVVCDKPYKIERLETSTEVIWFGHNTNWKKDKSTGVWHQLISGKFEPCEVPFYELEFTSKKTDPSVENLDAFHKHEFMDRTYIIQQIVNQFLVQHPTTIRNAKLEKELQQINEKLTEMYQNGWEE